MADQTSRAHWVEVKIMCDGEIAEALAELLGRFVSNGVVVESVTRFNPKTQENEPTGSLAVSGYLAADQNLEENRQKLAEALWHLSQISPIEDPQYTTIYDEDWMAAWKKHYEPIPIGENLLIMPAWIEPASGEKRLIVRINPAMAFGTGTHPTTQLCLMLLERHIKPGSKVLDIGCGSGILSIAALKMGAAHVLAVDVDSQAITSTHENATLNDISPAILETGMGSVEEILTGRFTVKEAPLVLVNILAPIIIRLFTNGLGQLVCEDGVLLLSGILKHQEAEVISVAQVAGFTVSDRLAQDDWVSLAMVKG